MVRERERDNNGKKPDRNERKPNDKKDRELKPWQDALTARRKENRQKQTQQLKEYVPKFALKPANYEEEQERLAQQPPFDHQQQAEAAASRLQRQYTQMAMHTNPIFQPQQAVAAAPPQALEQTINQSQTPQYDFGGDNGGTTSEADALWREWYDPFIPIGVANQRHQHQQPRPPTQPSHAYGNQAYTAHPTTSQTQLAYPAATTYGRSDSAALALSSPTALASGTPTAPSQTITPAPEQAMPRQQIVQTSKRRRDPMSLRTITRHSESPSSSDSKSSGEHPKNKYHKKQR